MGTIRKTKKHNTSTRKVQDKTMEKTKKRQKQKHTHKISSLKNTEIFLVLENKYMQIIMLQGARKLNN